MAKITFRKTIIVLFRSKVTASLPILGGILFIIGSVYFWPTVRVQSSHEIAATIGAWLFVTGSAFYTIAPILDYADMSLALKDALLKKPKDNAGAYERLYKAQVVRSQRANALLYAVAGGCYLAGSTLFFPDQRTNTTHGAWLYLVGCVLSFLAAFLAASSAYEMKRAAADAERERAESRPWARASTNPDALQEEKPKEGTTWGRFRKPEPQPATSEDVESKSASVDVGTTAGTDSNDGGGAAAAPTEQKPTRIAKLSKRWSDEDAAILTCALYMIGAIIFAVGSVFYFPKTIIGRHNAIYEGPPLLEKAAVVLFVIGSIIFTVGASIDMFVLIRAQEPYLIEGTNEQPAGTPNEATSLVGR